MQRLDDQRGAVAVLVALLMVPLLGFAAIAVDVGALYAERRQLQNGADAAALAIAQDCARGDCGDVDASAVGFASANANDEAADAVPVVAGNTVTVDTSTRRAADGGVGVAHWFAPVLGVDATTVRARASAAWGTPSAGPAMLPIAFSRCSFDPSLTETVQLIRYHNQSSLCADGPFGETYPGGFGWLASDPGQCWATVDTATAQTPGKPGIQFPLASCGEADLEAMKHAPVLLPVFEDADGTGNGGWYKLDGFAAFQLTGWRFGGDDMPSWTNWNNTTAPACTGNCRGVKGYFTRFVSLADGFSFGGPDLGASVVALTE